MGSTTENKKLRPALSLHGRKNSLCNTVKANMIISAGATVAVLSAEQRSVTKPLRSSLCGDRSGLCAIFAHRSVDTAVKSVLDYITPPLGTRCYDMRISFCAWALPVCWLVRCARSADGSRRERPRRAAQIRGKCMRPEQQSTPSTPLQVGFPLHSLKFKILISTSSSI